MRFLWAFSTIAISALAREESHSWNENNDPRQWSSKFEYKLSKLPTNGSIPTPAWSETYWPSYESGIAHRWNADDPQDFNYTLYTKDALLALQQNNNNSDGSVSYATLIASMSPAEKFDLFNGRYDYPLVHSEWTRTSPQDASWEGICHGWAPASLNFKQPNAIVLTNPDGLNVSFGSSDIKALLSYYVGQYDHNAETKFIGERCESDLDQNPADADREECADLDAGAFHVLISNQLGVEHQGFVVDVDRGYQVWNQPVNSFLTTISNATNGARINGTNGAAASVTVSTKMYYSKETYPQWQPHNAYQLYFNYEYLLDLDEDGKIIGGEMTSYDRVDFAWSQTSTPFHGYFKSLKQIYTAATRDETHPLVVRPVSTVAARVASVHAERHGLAGEIELHNYRNSEHRSWSIGNPEKCAEEHDNYVTVLRFADFETERYRDQLSVYEGAYGNGPLVAVLHGNADNQEVRVQGPCALVVFKADRSNSNFGGFEAKWEVLPQSEF